MPFGPFAGRCCRVPDLLWVSPWAWVIWALWLLLLPFSWLLCALTAALVHEAFHIAAVILAGGSVRRICVGCFGARIEAEGTPGSREALCILAGPFGSLLLVCLIRRFPVLGLCGLIQGGFNLLPICPLDGGRALQSLIGWVRFRKRP